MIADPNPFRQALDRASAPPLRPAPRSPAALRRPPDAADRRPRLLRRLRPARAGTASLWWCLPDTGWRCVECVEPPNPAEDDRARLAYGLAAPLPDDPTPAKETDHVR